MALIICPECGNSVSDKANTCIYCGFPISTYISYQQMPKVEDSFTSNTPSTTDYAPRHVKQSTHSRSTTKTSSHRTKKKSNRRSFSIGAVALVLVLIVTIAVIAKAIKGVNLNEPESVEDSKENFTVYISSGEYPWSDVPCYQDFSSLVEPYTETTISTEKSNILIDLVLNHNVIIENSEEYSSYIDSRITYKDCFKALEKKGCELSFFTKDSNEENYVLVAIRSQNEHELLALFEFAVYPESNNISLNSYASVSNWGPKPRVIGSSLDPTTFGESDFYYDSLEGKPVGTPYDPSFLAGQTNGLMSTYSEEYSLFTDDTGLPVGLWTSDVSIKVKDIESDVFMIYHEERYADDLLSTYFTEKYGDGNGYTYEYIGTTHNSFYVWEYDAYTCDVYKIISPKGQEEIYVIPFNLAGPIGVYCFIGDEIPSLYDYTASNGELKFLELVWTMEQAYNALFAQDNT